MKLRSIYQASLTALVLTGLGIAIGQPSSAATVYSVLDLGKLISPQTDIRAIDLNNQGQIVGLTSNYYPLNENQIEFHGFRTAANSPINPTTDYIDPQNGGFASPSAINDLAQVVGIIPFGNPEWDIYEAFRTSANSQVNAATDKLGLGSFSFAQSINNAGQVAVVTSSRFLGSFSYRTATNSPVNQATDDIGSLGGVVRDGPSLGSRFTSASAINDLGQVVGTSWDINLQTHAFRTAPNSPINPNTDDLRTLGGSNSAATAINNLGQVVGFSTTANGETNAFLTAPNSPITNTSNLGTLGGSFSLANDINNLGQVVGESTTANGERRAFLYKNGQIFDLNKLITSSLGVTLNSAIAVNNFGQILTNSEFIDPDGNRLRNRAFLLTPITSSTDVPEPSLSLSILILAAIAISTNRLLLYK
jgi:probable HAF family extracellular repeat protein